MPIDRSAMLGADVCVVRSTPRAGVTVADLEEHLDEHLGFMLGLESTGTLIASGPLTAGPGAAPGAGLTVVRGTDLAAAADLMSADPLLRRGLRTADIHVWRVMEGALTLRVSFGTGTYAIS